MNRIITQSYLDRFQDHLRREEKSPVTVEKYLRDVRAFLAFAGERAVTKELVIAYKQDLVRRGYAVRSINSMLASLNSLLRFLGWEDCKTRSIRQQRQTYCAQERQLTREEYLRLLEAARSRPRLYYLLQTICATGVRVSEIQYFTLEAVKRGQVIIRCKNKTRTILIPGKLRGYLLRYADKQKIRSGPIFVSRNGRPLDRSAIWTQMKGLCLAANVAPGKVFPHNLRKLFARAFYAIEKDIAKLADVLGHSSVNTTRIYIMTTGLEHRRQLERLGLVV